MIEPEAKFIDQWLEKAEHDLKAAELIIAYDPLIFDVACFHCQQAIEKYFKAYLIKQKQDFPKTHNLDLLHKKCSDINSSFQHFDLLNIEDFAVRGRYPHDALDPSFEETKQFYQVALSIKEFVIYLIKGSVK